MFSHRPRRVSEQALKKLSCTLQNLNGRLVNSGIKSLIESQRVRESVTRASIRLDMSEDNVAGVSLPKFVMREIEDSEIQLEKVGVFGGGQIIDQTRDKFKEFLRLVVDIASLQTSFLTLDEVIKVTSRRVNALEHIVIPRFQDVVKYILQELDEQAREEKFTMKKVLDTRQRLEKESIAMKLASAKAAGGLQAQGGQEEGTMIEEDPDIIF